MKNDGGYAFPESVITLGMDGKPVAIIKSGMTLRDYFAAAALHGMMAHDGWRDYGQPMATAKVSYAFADAMLAERMKCP